MLVLLDPESEITLLEQQRRDIQREIARHDLARLHRDSRPGWPAIFDALVLRLSEGAARRQSQRMSNRQA